MRRFHELQTRYAALQFGHGIGRESHSLWRAQRRQPLCRLTQIRPEIADAEARQSALHAVDDAGAFAHQHLPLAARSPRILQIERGIAAILQ